ncbi:replication initiation factor family protein, partial [Vibrio cholerae]|nr:replication initiation factor family protein [Vibrio cholerae]MVC24802.1 replication initiation factor family protein [Vibrio cholerae]MVC87730.1 replication initiation factor family protein [Vibrio cholerae]MVD78620.1 replication initiation factor family protein [Vibrio cholerae]MVE08588.1 replication initiation factor family protein [Vibrio cholerae]
MKKQIFTLDELQLDTNAAPFVFVDYLAWSVPYASFRHA